MYDYVRFRLFSLIVLCGQLLYTLICFTSPKLCAEMLKSLKTVISLYFNSALNSALLAPPFRLAGHIADAQGSLDLSLDTYSLTFLVGCYMCCGVTQRLKPWRKTGTWRTWTGTMWKMWRTCERQEKIRCRWIGEGVGLCWTMDFWFRIHHQFRLVRGMGGVCIGMQYGLLPEDGSGRDVGRKEGELTYTKFK